MEKFYSKLRVVVRVITICLAMAVFTSCGEDEPSPNPDNQEQTNNPSSGGEQNNPDNSGGTQGGESPLNKYGTDMSGEELAFVGCWWDVLGVSCYLFPDGKAGMCRGTNRDSMKGEEWLYDSDNKFLTTTYISESPHKSYQFYITGIFEDSWTGIRVGDSAGCSATRSSALAHNCLYAWLVSHAGVWYDEDGNQKKISSIYVTEYEELLELGKTIKVRGKYDGVNYIVIGPWGKSPRLQVTLKTGEVRTYTLKYE